MSGIYTIADFRRCFLMSAIVGTLLVTINQGPGFFLAPSTDFALLSRVALNYAVPFSVATVSAILANRARGSGNKASR